MLRYVSCWAEKNGTNGYGERWNDQWSEYLDPLSGRGNTVRTCMLACYRMFAWC